MEKKELLEKIKKLSQKEISLSDLCKALDLNEYEVLGLARELRYEGTNILIKRFDDDIYFFNQGERELSDDGIYNFELDSDNTFKFVAISNTIIGSISQQLSILNDIYLKALNNGFNNVFLVGNITAGLYPLKNLNADANFLDDSLRQVSYVVDHYPYIEGITTYLLTGATDETHLRKNKINVGKRIDALRDDMIYLGHSSRTVAIGNVNMLLFSPKLAKTYTVSYRPQQQIDSFRSEDKPNVLLYGGLLQMEKFPYRNVKCISIPSVCATTKEMNDKRYSNTVGAWYVTLKTNEAGFLESLEAIDSVYYKTNKDDYMKPKVLKLVKEKKYGK